MIKDLALFGARGLLGGYLAAHGAQKLFGSFDGPGIEAAGQHFSGMGLQPGKQMAQLAAVSELGGGALTALGVLDPIGPLAVAGTMAVAVTVHRAGGPFALKGGYELPLTNIALAGLLAATGPGKLRFGPKAPPRLAILAALGGAGLAAWSISKLLAGTGPTPNPPAEDHPPTVDAQATLDLTGSDVATAADPLG